MQKAVAVVIFLIGTATHAIAQQLDAAAPSREPVPGFHDGAAGTRTLRYSCIGEHSPTVLIEAGGATSFETLYSWEQQHGFRPGWLDVIAGIAKTTRVCVYDRAGLGRSGKASLPRTSADIASDLRALLRHEKISTPVICVGQSLGGSNCRILASQYPKLIAGMVLVDTSDADFWIRTKIAPPDLSKTAEWIDLEANATLLRKAKGIGNKPLVVLTASPTVPDPMIPPAQQEEANRIHQELQRELLALSTHSRQVIATKAGHNIQRDEPQLIVDAVLDVVNQVRERGAVSCGRIDPSASTATARQRNRRTHACIRAAQKAGRAVSFTHGYEVPPDFFVYNHVLLGAYGEKILDQISVSNDGNTDFVGRCAVLTIDDSGKLDFDGCEPDENLRMRRRKQGGS